MRLFDNPSLHSMDPTSLALLQLVRAGIHPDAELEPTSADVDWPAVSELASAQHVKAIAWDGYARLYEAGMVTVDMDRKKVKGPWLATVYLSFEKKYPEYRAKIGHLASILARNGIRMMVLKGYGLSLNYPVPEHRPCGDVDFWTFGEAVRADRVLEEELGVHLHGSPEHHTTFHFEEQYFEHHHNFVSAGAHPSNKVVEARLKELAMRGGETVDIDGHQVFLPSPDFNALFLLRHAASHLAGSEINIRQILDWGLLVQKYHDRIDWKSLEVFVESTKTTALYQILNGICVDYLGFSPAFFPAGRHPLEDRVLKDILCPEFSDPCPTFILSQWLWRLRRWRHGTWKQRLVYPEPLIRTFLVRLKTHLTHPGTLKM